MRSKSANSKISLPKTLPQLKMEKGQITNAYNVSCNTGCYRNTATFSNTAHSCHSVMLAYRALSCYSLSVCSRNHRRLVQQSQQTHRTVSTIILPQNIPFTQSPCEPFLKDTPEYYPPCQSGPYSLCQISSPLQQSPTLPVPLTSPSCTMWVISKDTTLSQLATHSCYPLPRQVIPERQHLVNNTKYLSHCLEISPYIISLFLFSQKKMNCSQKIQLLPKHPHFLMLI